MRDAVRQGYYDNDAATAAAFRAGAGWFDTGDLGWVAPRDVAGSRMAGTVVLSGRSKDTIVLSRCGVGAQAPSAACMHACTDQVCYAASCLRAAIGAWSHPLRASISNADANTRRARLILLAGRHAGVSSEIGICERHQLLRACSGENIEPQPIEDAVCESRFIKFCTVVGNDCKHLGALLVPDTDALSESHPGVCTSLSR